VITDKLTEAGDLEQEREGGLRVPWCEPVRWRRDKRKRRKGGEVEKKG